MSFGTPAQEHLSQNLLNLRLRQLDVRLAVLSAYIDGAADLPTSVEASESLMVVMAMQMPEQGTDWVKWLDHLPLGELT